MKTSHRRGGPVRRAQGTRRQRNHNYNLLQFIIYEEIFKQKL